MGDSFGLSGMTSQQPSSSFIFIFQKMKGAGFFSKFPKDLARLIFWHYLLEDGRVMLTAAANYSSGPALLAFVCKMLKKADPNWFDIALINKHYDITTWAVLFDCAYVNLRTLGSAAKHGSVVPYMSITTSPIEMLHSIAAGGQLENLRWLFAQNEQRRAYIREYYNLHDEVFKSALTGTKDTDRVRRVYRFLCEEEKHTPKVQLVDVIQHGNVSLLKEFIDSGVVDVRGKQCLFIQHSSIPMMEFLLAQGAVWEPVHWFANEKLENAPFETFVWAVEHGYPIFARITFPVSLMRKGYVDKYKWWYGKYPLVLQPFDLHYVHPQERSNVLKFVEWAKLQPRRDPLALIRICVRNNFMYDVQLEMLKPVEATAEDFMDALPGNLTQPEKVELLLKLTRDFELPKVTKTRLLEMLRGQKRRRIQ
jgi:hypothetical protein